METTDKLQLPIPSIVHFIHLHRQERNKLIRFLDSPDENPSHSSSKVAFLTSKGISTKLLKILLDLN